MYVHMCMCVYIYIYIYIYNHESNAELHAVQSTFGFGVCHCYAVIMTLLL